MTPGKSPTSKDFENIRKSLMTDTYKNFAKLIILLFFSDTFLRINAYLPDDAIRENMMNSTNEYGAISAKLCKNW